jgi:hypothetical protein
MTKNAFPAIGHLYKAHYGDLVFRVAFDTDGKTLRWAPFTAEDFETAATTETYQATYIRPCVFMVAWQEADGTTVAQVEDFENDIVHAAITMPDGKFLNLKGSWTRLD